jgi:glycosyltransferase involved in cell wall biosynthesis
MLEAALVTLGNPRRVTGGYLYHSRMAELAARHQARLRFVSFRSEFDPKEVSAVLGKVTEARPEVVIVDSIVAADTASWFGSPIPFPVVASVHQIPGGTSSNRDRHDRDIEVYRRMDRLILASESLQADFIRAGIDPSVIDVVPPGRDVAGTGEYVPADDREGKRKAARQGRKTSVLCVANWEPHKGIIELLDALESLPEDVATLHLVGDTSVNGQYRALVEARIGNRRLADRVKVHGVIGPSEVAEMYQAADVFVLPSTQDAYATAVGEAMALALPVIGWRAGNLPALADDDVEGRVLPQGDVAGLSKAIVELAADPDLRRRMGEAAYRRSKDRPTWEQSAAKWFGILRRVASRSLQTPNRIPKPER